MYQVTGAVSPILEVCSTKGVKLMSTSETTPRAIEREWKKFSAAIRAAVPHVVINVQANPNASQGGLVL